jgi:hypothetical protein
LSAKANISRSEMYQCYRSVLMALDAVPSHTDQTRYDVLNALIGTDAKAWAVVGITEAALAALRANGYRRSKVAIERGHFTAGGRREMHRLLIPVARAGDQDEFNRIRDDFDRTVLMTKEENRSDNHGKVLFWLEPPAEGMFANKTVGFGYRLGKEAAFDAAFRAG